MYNTQNAAIVYYLQNTPDWHGWFRGAEDACSPIHDAIKSSNLTSATFSKIFFDLYFSTHIASTTFPRLFFRMHA